MGIGGPGGCSNHPATNEPLVKCGKLILDMCGRGMGRDETDIYFWLSAILTFRRQALNTLALAV